VALTLYIFGRSWVRFSAGTRAILSQDFRVFPQSLQTNAGVAISFKSRPPLFTFLPIHPTSDAIQHSRY
jgi:hypothetical protein